jgi:hypothetical protein
MTGEQLLLSFVILGYDRPEVIIVMAIVRKNLAARQEGIQAMVEPPSCAAFIRLFFSSPTAQVAENLFLRFLREEAGAIFARQDLARNR